MIVRLTGFAGSFIGMESMSVIDEPEFYQLFDTFADSGFANAEFARYCRFAWPAVVFSTHAVHEVEIYEESVAG